MGRKQHFNKLFEPFRLGKVKMRNRIVKTASIWGEMASVPSLRLYEAIAKGGVGLIMIPVLVMSPESVDASMGSSGNSQKISGYDRLVDIIHQNGCPVFLEMTHIGAWQVGPPGAPGPLPISASSLPDESIPKPSYDRFASNAHELTVNEIKEIVNEVANVCEQGKKIGFDGVEINASRCHLFNSFLSRHWNRRSDEYGTDSIKSRTRIVAEIIQEIKTRLGKDFPVCVQINAVEYALEKGITIEEGKMIANELEAAGADALEVRAYGYGEYYNRLHIPEQIFYPEPPRPLGKELDGRYNGAGVVIPLAAMIKTAVSIPVITVGKIPPFLGEQALQEGKADFIGICRGLFADPNLPNKLSAGKVEDIAPCTNCMECFRFYGRSSEPNASLRCRVNSDIGREDEYKIGSAQKPKQVIVVGGGPAGLEAARIAALRGHKVTLFEKERTLGGQLYLAAIIKGKEVEDLMGLLEYLKHQVLKAGVTIKTGYQADESTISKLKPDAVILATGSTPTDLKIPGIDHRKVLQSTDLHAKAKLALRWFGFSITYKLIGIYLPVGKNVVIMGGSMHGCELAEFLVKRGRRVSIVETSDQIGHDLIDLNRARLFAWFQRKGVAMLSGVTFESISDQGLTIINREGETEIIQADSIIPVPPPAANRVLYYKLKDKFPEVHLIGDCVEPRLIIEAIADASRVVRSLG